MAKKRTAKELIEAQLKKMQNKKNRADHTSAEKSRGVAKPKKLSRKKLTIHLHS